jgi:sporulation protein YlmC with PRC-barrel domain
MNRWEHLIVSAALALALAPATALAEVRAGAEGERPGTAERPPAHAGEQQRPPAHAQDPERHGPPDHARGRAVGVERDQPPGQARRTGEVVIIERQMQEQFLADDLIGSAVQNQQGEEIGQITDLLLSRDGEIVGVVIGVGGFLGVGQRDVGLQWTAIELAADADGDPIVRVDVDRATLEQAREIELREDTGLAVWGETGERERTVERRRVTGEAAFIERQEQHQFSAERLTGSKVRNAQGEEIGDVSEVLLDHDGRIAAVVIGIGGFLGVGQREVGISWDALELTADEDGEPMVRVDVDRQTLERATEFQYRDEADRVGVWGERREQERDRVGVAERERTAVDRNFIARQESGQFSAERLIGMTLRSAQGEDLGEISDLLIDRDGNVTGVVVGVGGFLGIGRRDVGVSWDALELTTDEDGEPVAQVEIDRATLRNAPRLEIRND